ncbi:unnamed protein product, partial [Musa acuminata var. zebrina]
MSLAEPRTSTEASISTSARSWITDDGAGDAVRVHRCRHPAVQGRRRYLLAQVLRVLLRLHELAMMVEAEEADSRLLRREAPPTLGVGRRVAFAGEPEEVQQGASGGQDDTVGLTFDSKTGNWSELVSRTANIVMKSMKEEKA